MSADVERVARAMCRSNGVCVGFCHVERCRSAIDNYGPAATAAMRETRRIDEEALRAMSAENRLWMDGDDMIDWLTTRAGEQP